MALAVALGVLSVVMPAMSASAAKKPQLVVRASDLVVAPGPYGKLTAIRTEVTPENTTLSAVTLKIDTKALAGVATLDYKFLLDENDKCTESGTTITCQLDTSAQYLIDWATVVHAAEGARPGKAGHITYTLSSPQAASASKTVEIAIVDGVNLANVRNVTGTAKPGSTFGADVAVANTGTKAVTGVELRGTFSDPIELTKRFSNCRYGQWVQRYFYRCSFPVTIAPGQIFAVQGALPVALPQDTWAPHRYEQEFRWNTSADGTDDAGFWEFPAGTPGRDGELKLVARASVQGRTAGRQSDIDDRDNGGTITITAEGDNRPNLAGVGVAASGTIGKPIVIKPGVQNRGPGRLVGTESWAEIARLTLPANVTVVTAASNCWVPDDARANQYKCIITDTMLRAGRTLTFPFTVKVTRASGAAGAVTAGFIERFTTRLEDPVPGDDTAPITVTGKAAPATPGGSPVPGPTGTASPSGGTPPAPGQGGASLPVTGASLTGMLAAGAAAMLLGAGAVVLTRRRKAARG
jgi:LPXTG-motif cell wall-anchored protein